MRVAIVKYLNNETEVTHQIKVTSKQKSTVINMIFVFIVL